MTKVLLAIGLMSGTSMDGVDVAMIETDGDRVTAFGPSGYRPYTDNERALLRQALADAVGLTDRKDRPGVLAEAEQIITAAHAEAVETFLSAHGIARGTIAIVGFHGQTVLHRPLQRLTVQIGDAQGLATRLGLPVVYDMRAADVAAGGQGAPLVPVYHRALARGLDRDGPLVVVNIGGVSNITYIDGDDDLIACDTGPGNALLDDFVLQSTGRPFDAGGALAAQGQVDEAWVSRALQNPFFNAAPPKSLDRNHFAALRVDGKSPADGAATLTAFTAATIAAIVPLLPKPPHGFVVAGGGAQNPTLLSMLRARVVPASVESADALGWSADAIEAQAFAFLAVRSLNGMPLTFPGTTGVAAALTGGALAEVLG